MAYTITTCLGLVANSQYFSEKQGGTRCGNISLDGLALLEYRNILVSLSQHSHVPNLPDGEVDDVMGHSSEDGRSLEPLLL